MLLVDDEEVILSATREYFIYKGFHVDCAQTGGDAAELLAHRTYSVVIVDLHLELGDGDSGLDVVRRVRRHNAATRIVVLSGLDTESAASEAIAGGADVFLSKPKRLSELASTVETLLATNETPILGGG